MPSLYGFTGNSSNVSVGNTTGLYIGSGNVTILNSAQTLFNLLSNSSSIGWELVNNNQDVTGVVLPTGIVNGTYGNATYYPTFTVGSDGRLSSVTLNSVAAAAGAYGNANVAIYLPTYNGTLSPSSIYTNNYFYANGQPFLSSLYSNANVASYMPVYGGNVLSSNLNTTNVYSNNYFYANGQPFASSSYGNANVAAFLPTYGGQLGNADQIFIGNSSSATGVESIAIGSGATSNSFNSMAIGPFTPVASAVNTIAIGAAARATQNYVIAIGSYAGYNSNDYAIAIGQNPAGYSAGQATHAIAIGSLSGNNQGAYSVAIGSGSGYNQGSYSVAIGTGASAQYQAANSIAINAGTSNLNPGNSGFFVNPVRNDNSNIAQIVFFNTTTNELTYSAASTLAYGNSNVAAYLASNTDPTISTLNANTHQVQSQFVSVNNSIAGANSSIQTLSANVGSYYTYANATYQFTANSYGNANVATYLPTYTGHLGNATTISIGQYAGTKNQGSLAIAIGQYAGNTSQTSGAVAVGNFAGYEYQGQQSVAVGAYAAETSQGQYAVAVGYNAGQEIQGFGAVAIGEQAGQFNQASYATAVGSGAGIQNQGNAATAIGTTAGESYQGINAVAIGNQAGASYQGFGAVAIGWNAGLQYQGGNSIAIGSNTGVYNQAVNSIAFNATGNILNVYNPGFYVNPIRNDGGNVTQTVYYNTVTNELTYATSGAGTLYSNTNVSAYLSSGLVSNINTSGNITTTANVVASGNFYGNLIAANIVVANIGIQNYTSYGSVGSPTYNAGVLWYDNVQDSIAYYSSITNNEVNVGQELQFNAWNGTGSQINQGVPVYLTGGSLNNLPNIAPAQANTISTSQIAGVANQNIPANTKGAVVTIGIVANVAMGSFSVGDTLYLSPYSAGQIQNTQPPTGYVVKIGTVLYNNSPNGRFLVNKTVPVNNQYFGNLTVTGVTTTGNLTTTNGVYWANGVSYGSTFASSYGNANVASYLASGTDATINAINSNVTAANAAISTLQVAPIFVGNLAGNVLYDGIYKRANIQAYPINYIQNSTTSYYQSAFLNSGNPVYDASNLLYANATVSGTTQGNVTLRTAASPPQQTFGFQEQFQVFAANTPMVNGDRVRGMGSSLEIFTKPNGTVNGVWSNYVAFTGTTYPTYAQQNAATTPVLAAHQAYMGISGTGNVYTAAGLYVSSTLNPSNGNINMNIQQGLNIGLGWVGAIGQVTQTPGRIDIARGIQMSIAKGATSSGSNATIANGQTIVHAQGVYFQANWHTGGNVGFLPTGMIRSIQSEDPLTELYNAGNVIVGGNLTQTGSANLVTISGATTFNNNVTINGASSLLQVTTYTVTALNAITGVSGQIAAVSNGTAKNGGQLAYWDTTNARWSWFDTNLAVS